MPTFALLAWDREDVLELRARCRPKHLEGLAPLDAAGRIRYGGPMLGDDGKPRGSVVVFDADSLADARRIVEADPYVTEGVFARWELHPMKNVFPGS